MKSKNSGMNMHYIRHKGKATSQRNKGFTLVEMMVTLVIMMMLFGIIFVPLNQAFNFFHLGQTRTNLQQAARQALEQISSDLRTAVRVFPNDITPGITTEAPYIEGTACSDTRRANLSRIDFIPARKDNEGSVILPVQPARYLVTYYGRRLTVDRSDRAEPAYDAITNPIILFRAQSAIYNGDESLVEASSGVANIDISSNRYSAGSCNDRSSSWLMQRNGEPNLEFPWGIASPTATDIIATDSDTSQGDLVSGSHTRAIPLGVSLTAPRAGSATPDYTPLTTFVCIDSNNDGKLDQVKINLALEETVLTGTTNNNGQQPEAQRVRMSTTVDLPNIM
jgi:prepilin-type N-terminal cleavage/methylation domain-containing protein